jgi:hypothetical protein
MSPLLGVSEMDVVKASNTLSQGMVLPGESKQAPEGVPGGSCQGTTRTGHTLEQQGVVEPEMVLPAHGVMGRPTATEQGVPGGRCSRTQTQAPAPVAVTQPGIDKGNTDEDIWEIATLEDIENNHRGIGCP